MDSEKKKNIFVGVLALLSIPFGIFIFYNYFFAPPAQFDHFDLGAQAPTCIPLERGGYALQMPVTTLTDWATIDRVTLVGAEDIVIERAGLLKPGEPMRESFAPTELASLSSAEDGWFKLGLPSPGGQVLVLLLNSEDGQTGTSESVELGTYGGETRSMDRLEVSVVITNGECRTNIYRET